MILSCFSINNNIITGKVSKIQIRLNPFELDWNGYDKSSLDQTKLIDCPVARFLARLVVPLYQDNEGTKCHSRKILSHRKPI